MQKRCLDSLAPLISHSLHGNSIFPRPRWSFIPATLTRSSSTSGGTRSADSLSQKCLQSQSHLLLSKRGVTSYTSQPLHIMPTNEVKRDDSFNQEVFNLSLALTHSRLNDSTELQCILFHADSSFEPSCQSMTKARIAKEYDLDARDLRNIDLVSTGLPHILVRPDTIFASLFYRIRKLAQASRQYRCRGRRLDRLPSLAHLKAGH